MPAPAPLNPARFSLRVRCRPSPQGAERSLFGTDADSHGPIISKACAAGTAIGPRAAPPFPPPGLEMPWVWHDCRTRFAANGPAGGPSDLSPRLTVIDLFVPYLRQ